MSFLRNTAFPVVWKLLRASGRTQETILTREIKIYADGIAGIVLDIIADMHIGGVHKDLNAALLSSQTRAQEIIGTTPRICIDAGDRLTLGSLKCTPTQLQDVLNLWDFFSPLAQQSEWGYIWWVHGNHDRRMLEKVSSRDLSLLNGATNEMWLRQIIQPVKLAWGHVQIHGMPCYNTQPEQYGSKIIRELIANINAHTGVNIVMVHNPDGVKHIESKKKTLGLSIDVPTLFVCGHTHGLLGFPDVPLIGKSLSHIARKWIGMEPDTPYISGYTPSTGGEPYGIFVSQGMGDQADIFRVLSGNRERPIIRFVERESSADIVLGGR